LPPMIYTLLSGENVGNGKPDIAALRRADAMSPFSCGV
jgi:hypothetical protein